MEVSPTSAPAGGAQGTRRPAGSSLTRLQEARDPRSPSRNLRALASALAPGTRPDLFTNSPAPGDPEPQPCPAGHSHWPRRRLSPTPRVGAACSARALDPWPMGSGERRERSHRETSSARRPLPFFLAAAFPS